MREKNVFTFNLMGSYCRVLSRGVTCKTHFKRVSLTVLGQLQMRDQLGDLKNPVVANAQ